MRKSLLTLCLLVGFGLGFAFNNFLTRNNLEETISFVKPPEKPLKKYEFDALTKTDFKPGKITIKNMLTEGGEHKSFLFDFNFNPNLDGKTYKKTTGMVNLPASSDGSSQIKGIIVMLRGFVSQEIYKTGIGTKNTAAYFADNGYITIAPDFLGYADSDREAEDIFESRFQTYVTVVSLLKTLEEFKTNQTELVFSDSSTVQLSNSLPIFIWGHSNGGQIAISVLEITGATYPTVLWAPVSKPFPYSILYYTDEAPDGGKFLREKLAAFEKLYDTDNYSLTNYLENVRAPIQLNQGTADESVPKTWSENFADMLMANNVDVIHFKYSGADHNMQPLWSEAVNNSLNFFDKYTAAN